MESHAEKPEVRHPAGCVMYAPGAWHVIFGCDLDHGSAKVEPEGIEYRVVGGISLIERTLNEMAAEGWRYVGTLPGAVLVSRPLVRAPASEPVPWPPLDDPRTPGAHETDHLTFTGEEADVLVAMVLQWFGEGFVDKPSEVQMAVARKLGLKTDGTEDHDADLRQGLGIEDDEKTKPRTPGERRAFVKGYAEAVKDVTDHGLIRARAHLRLLSGAAEVE